MNAGKGSSPRNCFSKQFKDNYDEINWSPIINKYMFCEEAERIRIKEIEEKEYEIPVDYYIKNPVIFEEYNDEKWYEISNPISEWQGKNPDLSEDEETIDKRYSDRYGD